MIVTQTKLVHINSNPTQKFGPKGTKPKLDVWVEKRVFCPKTPQHDNELTRRRENKK